MVTLFYLVLFVVFTGSAAAQIKGATLLVQKAAPVSPSLVVAMVAPPASLGGSITLAWDPSPDASVINYHIYASTDRISWAVAASTAGTNVTLPHAKVPSYYQVTALDASGLESGPSNTLWLQGMDTITTVTAESTAQFAPSNWMPFATVLRGTNLVGTNFYRLKINTANQWQTVSLP